MIKKRDRVFDLAKGFSLFLMVNIHVFDELGPELFQDTWYATLVYFIGSPAGAPAFIFLMGVLFQMSSRDSLKMPIIRGVKLFLIGYLLNICRYVIPLGIATNSGVITSSDFAPDTLSSLFWVVDILQFAGLALIVMALVKKYLKNPLIYLLLGIATVAISPLVVNQLSSSPVANVFLELLWGKSANINFPLIPWLYFSLLGMSYGYFYKKRSECKKFLVSTILIGVVLSSVGAIMLYHDPLFNLGEIHKLAIGFLKINMIIFLTGELLLFLAIYRLLCRIVPANPLFDRFYYWSQNITSFYFIQWMFVGWISVEIDDLSWVSGVAMIIVILATTDRLIFSWNKLKVRYF